MAKETTHKTGNKGSWRDCNDSYFKYVAFVYRRQLTLFSIPLGVDLTFLAAGLLSLRYLSGPHCLTHRSCAACIGAVSVA